jgi:5,10-methenyltetrahydromethanopterin hydrogenase
MSPQETLNEMLNALVRGDTEEAIIKAGELNGWIGRGGFQPDYKKAVWDLFEKEVREDPRI